MKRIGVTEQFATEEGCLSYLEQMRWPQGVRCPRCGSQRICRITTNGSTRRRFSRRENKLVEVNVPARHLYECLNQKCRYQFTATVGTILEATHLPLQKWFMAVALLANDEKPMSSRQLQERLGVNYRTASYLSHRVRDAVEQGDTMLTHWIEVFRAHAE
jgi:transposase-like protein